MIKFELSVALIAISRLKGMGRKRVLDFLNEVYNRRGEYNFSYEDIVASKISTLKKLVDMELNETSWDFQCNKAREIIENSQKKGITTINFMDETYPKELFILPVKPLVLFIKGKVELLMDEKKIAIIGTRNPSTFAKKMTPRITKQFSKLNYTVVSGLALGCDTLAHEMASIENGKTIAVLAHGLDMPVYPKQNRELAEDILRNGGVLVSEYPMGTKLRPSFLVERDEWQSGMSLGTIMIESSVNGGSRHASFKAIEQQRILGVLDHTQQKNSNGLGIIDRLDDSIGLNQQLIMEKKAMPLYDLESIFTFNEQMLNIKEIVNTKANNLKLKEEKLTKDNVVQTSLFNQDY
ncbi:DNA-processing protein DprA [Streptococcus ferus]|uniref:DNA-processing protein DprA n=1 Tax=Streptococcus ferus TaxID=1345 RepID=UPI0035A16A8F